MVATVDEERSERLQSRAESAVSGSPQGDRLRANVGACRPGDQERASGDRLPPHGQRLIGISAMGLSAMRCMKL